jgi:hypothetical protein
MKIPPKQSKYLQTIGKNPLNFSGKKQGLAKHKVQLK